MRDWGQIYKSVLVVCFFIFFLILSLNVLKSCLLFETGHGGQIRKHVNPVQVSGLDMMVFHTVNIHLEVDHKV